MRKTTFWNNLLSTKTRKIVASALALSMVLSCGAYATSDTSKTAGKVADVAATTTTFLNGDVNGDGQVTLEDAQLALKGALKIQDDFTEAQFYAADVDSNDKLELADAQLILKAALKIQALPDKKPMETPVVSEAPVETPTPTITPEPVVSKRPTLPPDDVKPSYTPRPSLNPVIADEKNVVTDYKTVAVEQSNQVQAVPVTDAKGNTYTQYVFGPKSTEDITQGAIDAAGVDAKVKELVSTDGMQMVNPYKNREDLRQTAKEATRTERINGKQTVWELTGAALETLTGAAANFDRADVRVANSEPQGHKFCDQVNIDYTRPEWKYGISFSFWVNTDSMTNGDPLLTFANNQYAFTIKLNGTVRFLDTNSTKERNQLYLQSDQIYDGFGGWKYFTVTIKNDWVQVYVNGQENVYTKISMNRGTIQNFNDGFLTRYNPVSVITKEDVDKDVRQYYTGSDSTGHTPWYYNKDTGEYEGHDDYSIFVNGRFGGKAKGDPLLMDLITDETTTMWIGGVDVGFETEHNKRTLTMNSNIADIRTYETELTPEQVAANYEYTTVTPEAVYTWDVKKAEVKDETVVTGKLDIKKTGSWATYDEATDVVTFKAPTGRADKITGVELNNPFAGQEEIRETIYDALTGQAIFPYLAVNGGTIETAEGDGPGCSRFGVEVKRGNFYDVWYGDPATPGNLMNPATGVNDNSMPVTSIMTLEQLEAAYGNQKYTYQRPKWNNGLTVSFWVKPVEIDDSPILTFLKPKNMLFNLSVRGDVNFYSLDGNNWYKGAVAPNYTPYNTFSALGDPSYVKAGEWNYYTVTFENDWITVYVNGQEMVYTKANLNRGYCKFFNKSYLTKYNPTGHWTTDMLAAKGDPTGTTLEGTPRNYLTKSGFLYDLTITDLWENPDVPNEFHSALSDKGFNNNKDSAAVRATGVYANPFRNVTDQCKLLIDYMTDEKVSMYLGGAPSVINAESQYTFQDLTVTSAEAVTVGADGKENEIIHSKGDAISDKLLKVFFSDHTLDEGTQMTGVSTELKALTAEEVKANYNKVAKPQ